MSHGVVVWFTGLPSSGKSKLARALRERLGTHAACVLDGDVVRALMVPTPGYSEQARGDFYATLAGLAAELSRQGLFVLVPATAHLRHYREHARRLAPRFIEVWVSTPLEECERRDDKGFYAAGRANAASDLPGVGPSYEPPESPDVQATGGDDLGALARILELLDERGPPTAGAGAR